MKLTGKLKKQVEAAATMEEKKEAIENAGMILNDEELIQVSGGILRLTGTGEFLGGEDQQPDRICVCEKPERDPVTPAYCKKCGYFIRS